MTCPKHSAVVRVTHWITALCFFALLLSGLEIIVSHPRFYWGETGNVLTQPLFQIPIPASRSTVPTGYSFVMPDQNGWSRSLHFQSAWAVVIAGMLYGAAGLWTGHFRKNLLPSATDLSWRSLSASIASHLSPSHLSQALLRGEQSYNVLQRLAYLLVIFLVFPLMIWTGLAMSPAFVSAFPGAMEIFGGHQSARTIHFFATMFLVLFVIVHIGMVWLAGFRSRMRAMIMGE